MRSLYMFLVLFIACRASLSAQEPVKDSVYISDMTYDCEQEGTLRFRDPVTDKVGFFDKNRKVIIPAAYNDARPFYNGLALVIHDGKRICEDGSAYVAGSCEHWSWDGITGLINTKGIIVADSIDMMATENLNWFSLNITDEPGDTSLYSSIKATNKSYYTFINYQKEFDSWYHQQFLPQSQAGNMTFYCFDELQVEGLWKQKLRKKYSKGNFLKQYGTIMQKRMGAVIAGQIEAFIVTESLNSIIYNNKKFKTFYTACDEPNTAQFPSFEVITNHYNIKHELNYQEHFSFLRTDTGYKLIAVAMKNIG